MNNNPYTNQIIKWIILFTKAKKIWHIWNALDDNPLLFWQF